MGKKHFSISLSKKWIFIIGGLAIIASVIFFSWGKIKNRLIQNKINAIIAAGTDSLYSIKYDSFSFDEKTGNAFLKNIYIIPDTLKIKELTGEKQPYIFLEATINSIMLSGLKTSKALSGDEIAGDSVIIDAPQITMYSLKPLRRETKIEAEATTVYREILGNLELIKAKYVAVNHVKLKETNFYTKEKNFDLINATVQLEDVLIDSTHNLDTTRVLFCKQAAFTADSFSTYSKGRKELTVKGINFSGNRQSLIFNEILLNQFENETAHGTLLLQANTLSFSGVNTNELVKNKNIIVDTILCKHIMLNEPFLNNLRSIKISAPEYEDSTGFSHVYSIHMKHLNFPKVAYISGKNSNYSLGNITIKINEVKAGQIAKVELYPLDMSKEVEVTLSWLSVLSNDQLHEFLFRGMALNSSQKQLRVDSFNIIPLVSENDFANKAGFQKDRFNVRLGGIVLKNIEMQNLLQQKIIASQLLINNASAKIYRDISKPLEQKNKVGNYPSQLLKALDIPVNISKASLPNAYIEYKEKGAGSGNGGIVRFEDSKLDITNITNIPEAIQENNFLNISFDTKVSGQIPLKGNFKFSLKNNGGNFTANGHIPAFDPLILNKISIPMTLIKLNGGKINSIDFQLTGNNYNAKGDFLMRYQHLKVDVLKKDKDTKQITKRGFASFVANLMLRNDNPNKKGLRKVRPVYERDIYKSFFNLVWKTVFTGMKETVGLQ